MYTEDGFRAEWQRRHHHTADLSGDVDFYYAVYRRLYVIAAKSSGRLADDVIVSLAMYVENSAAVGLAPVYERMYGSAGDMVWRWCKVLGVSAGDCALMNDYVAEAVAAAPADGSLRRWIIESVLSGNFNRLDSVAQFFARQDPTLGLLYPTLSFREDMYMKLADNDKAAAGRMLWADMAFNWRDKTGMSVLRRLARLLGSADDGRQAAANLLTVSPVRLDAYLPDASCGDNSNVALVNKDGRAFTGVVFSTPLPQDYHDMCFTGQLVTYLGRTYVNGPGTWRGRGAYGRWNGETLWAGIENSEKEDARRTMSTAPYGKKISRYDDLYQSPEAPAGACGNSLGISLDGPGLLDFLDWLAPKENLYSTKQ